MYYPFTQIVGGMVGTVSKASILRENGDEFVLQKEDFMIEHDIGEV